MKILTTEEAKLFYKCLQYSLGPKDVFLQILFETGARVSETLSLHAGSLVGDKLTIEPLKGSNRRVVTISPNLAAKLRRLPKTRWSQSLGETVRHHSLRRTLCRHFHARSIELLGRRLNIHSLRHTALSRLYVATKDLLLVKEWAGHRSMSSTLRYMQLDQREAANEANSQILKALNG